MQDIQGPPPFEPDEHVVPPARRGPGAAWLRDPRRLALAVGVLALVLVVFALAGRDGGVGAARSDLKESAEVVRDRERDVAKAQQELEERLADLQAARAQVQANAVKLNAEASKERRDARDTMVVGGEVVEPGDAERSAEAALERSRESVGPVRRP